MKELKPCPFCGGAAVIIRQTYIEAGHDDTILEYYKYRPTCLRCFAHIPEDRYKTAKDAINAWNGRVQEVSE